jgi:hypothetical protein
MSWFLSRRQLLSGLLAAAYGLWGKRQPRTQVASFQAARPRAHPAPPVVFTVPCGVGCVPEEHAAGGLFTYVYDAGLPRARRQEGKENHS